MEGGRREVGRSVTEIRWECILAARWKARMGRKVRLAQASPINSISHCKRNPQPKVGKCVFYWNRPKSNQVSYQQAFKPHWILHQGGRQAKEAEGKIVGTWLKCSPNLKDGSQEFFPYKSESAAKGCELVRMHTQRARLRSCKAQLETFFCRR